jgi:hypothetical protein
VSAVLIIFLESVRSVDKKLFGAFTLVAILFIYVGFAWNGLYSLVIVVIFVVPFVALLRTCRYTGSQYSFRNLIILSSPATSASKGEL